MGWALGQLRAKGGTASEEKGQVEGSRDKPEKQGEGKAEREVMLRREAGEFENN